MTRNAEKVLVGDIPEDKSESRSKNYQDLFSRDQSHTLVVIDTPVLGWITNGHGINAH